MKKQVCINLLLFCCLTCYGQNSSIISVDIVQPEVYVVKDVWSQQLNFDLSIENRTSEAIELKEVELYVYDKNKGLINIKRLYDGGVSSSIKTIPVRRLQKNEKITVYNPFTAFNPYIDLYCLKYRLSFDGDSKNSYTVEVDVKPKLYISKTELSLPLKETIFVLDGNDLYSNHRRFDVNDPIAYELLNIHTTPGLFAIDFSMIDSLGNKYSGERDNMSYYIWGKTVYAPANGKIVKTHNQYEDNKPSTLNFNVQDAKTNKDLLSGNCVVIDHLNGEYSFLVHLKKGSITVKEGEMVRKGQPIGQVGNSGSSMYPHLHYQLSDKPDYINSNGLPIYFHNYHLISGDKKIKMKKGYINTGDIVENK